MEGRESMITKGQFGEHFERKSGGYYIRVIGYTLDDQGYQQFLINLSTAKIVTEEVELPTIDTIVPPASTDGDSDATFAPDSPPLWVVQLGTNWDLRE